MSLSNCVLTPSKPKQNLTIFKRKFVKSLINVEVMSYRHSKKRQFRSTTICRIPTLNFILKGVYLGKIIFHLIHCHFNEMWSVSYFSFNLNDLLLVILFGKMNSSAWKAICHISEFLSHGLPILEENKVHALELLSPIRASHYWLVEVPEIY